MTNNEYYWERLHSRIRTVCLLFDATGMPEFAGVIWKRWYNWAWDRGFRP